MKAAQKSYKLIKYGDPLLTKVSIPITLPLDDSVDTIIDECINSLVRFLASLLKRNVEGYWHQKSISCAAPQVGYH